MWRYLLPAGLFAILVAFFYVGLQRRPGEIPSPFIGKPAPAFSLPGLPDPAVPVSTTNFSGRPYILNVWATWCSGCRQEHDTLLEIARSRLIPIVGLNWKDERGPALSWLATLGNPYEAVAFDQEGRVAIDWGVYGAPETFLVSSKGAVLYKHIAPLTMEVWNKEFVPRIRADQGDAP